MSALEQFEPPPDESELAETIFDMHITQRMSMRKIAAQLRKPVYDVERLYESALAVVTPVDAATSRATELALIAAEEQRWAETQEWLGGFLEVAPPISYDEVDTIVKWRKTISDARIQLAKDRRKIIGTDAPTKSEHAVSVDAAWDAILKDANTIVGMGVYDIDRARET